MLYNMNELVRSLGLNAFYDKHNGNFYFTFKEYMMVLDKVMEFKAIVNAEEDIYESMLDISDSDYDIILYDKTI